MADEAIATPAIDTVTTEAPAAATPSAGTQKPDSQAAEVMIPKSRLDEVLAKLKTFEQDKTKAEKEREATETARLAEQGKYKEIADGLQAKLEAAQAAERLASTKVLQRDAAAQTGLPVALASRLQGESLEDMIADAKAILGALPKPPAPNLNGANGDGSVPRNGSLDEDAKRRLADKYGVKPEYIT